MFEATRSGLLNSLNIQRGQKLQFHQKLFEVSGSGLKTSIQILGSFFYLIELVFLFIPILGSFFYLIELVFLFCAIWTFVFSCLNPCKNTNAQAMQSSNFFLSSINSSFGLYIFHSKEC